MQIKWANKIEFWTEVRSGGGTGPWTWTKVVDYSPTYSGSWTNVTLTYAWPKINDWNRWYWKIKNTNCCVETPIYHRKCTYPPPYVPPPPSYRLEYANYSEYSLDTTVDIISVPTGAYSNGTNIKYMHISWDTHTAPDQMVLNWTAPGMGTLIDTGYVLGVYTYTVPMPQVSTVPPGGASIDFVENGDSWHSGWEVAIVVNYSP
jgi:hypothetical protein